MIFKQLFEPVSSTYTYLLGCEDTGQALLIDPVLPTWERDLAEANTLHQAIDGAAQKMKRSLDSTLGKLGEHKHRSLVPNDEDES